MTTTIVPTLTVESAALDAVKYDMYRNIHKGIRYVLGGVTTSAGRVDPGDDTAVEALGAQWHDIVRLLVGHAEHENDFIGPLLDIHAPALGSVIADQHEQIEHQLAQLEVLADRAVGSAVADRRAVTHRLYLALASFTATFFQHMELEELEVNPTLSQAISVEGLREVEHELVASLSPEEVAQAAALMLPAMNVEDHVEWFGGMRAGAPPEAFAGVLGLARTVLDQTSYEKVASRLGV